jgi:hypothetical protein
VPPTKKNTHSHNTYSVYVVNLSSGKIFKRWKNGIYIMGMRERETIADIHKPQRKPPNDYLANFFQLRNAEYVQECLRNTQIWLQIHSSAANNSIICMQTLLSGMFIKNKLSVCVCGYWYWYVTKVDMMIPC